MPYAHGCYSIYHLKLTLLSHSTPWPILTKSVLTILLFTLHIETLTNDRK
ncbi:CCN_G0047240.mRNA.1.CDS.1 [Saccharomyces cerevisiae]|nr:CCN_G0047240.mRNA.1.CDS.1 [Saccharomyces cerevisiae]CAI7449377.1 CCN_G0047240.mRNA.1.CDS.1 [Saccharomyces cerevisiae]